MKQVISCLPLTKFKGQEVLKNKTIGSMLIVAGTTIGAGMLALPIASAGLGFTTALSLIFLTWVLMTYTALLMLELHHGLLIASNPMIPKNLIVTM